jgi:hypothetical protein
MVNQRIPVLKYFPMILTLKRTLRRKTFKHTPWL